MTIPKLTPYTGQVANPDGSQTQTEFTQNMFDQLSYETQLATQLDATIDSMNQAVTDVENSAAEASASAAAAEVSASTAGYKGLWPDTGGAAEKGDTYQTQTGGTPTGEYYTALQNTTVAPVGDNVNWKAQNDYGELPGGLSVRQTRGSNAQIMATVIEDGRIVKNNDDGSIHIGDGATKGGFKHVNVDTLTSVLTDYTEPTNNAAFGKSGVQYIAHRGLSQFAPENTLPAYEAAGRGGFFGGECDIQVCATGEWVLMHDLTVDRTTDGTGQVPSLTLSYLKSLDAGSWYSSYYTGTKVPTLVEYLKTCKRFGLTPVPEVKSATYSDDNISNLIADCLSVFPDYQFVVISFDLTVLQQIRAKDKNVRLQLVVMNYSEAEVDKCIALKKCDIDARWINMPSDLSYAKENGILINTWTVNTPDEAEAATEAGVKFITSDFINYGE